MLLNTPFFLTMDLGEAEFFSYISQSTQCERLNAAADRRIWLSSTVSKIIIFYLNVLFILVIDLVLFYLNKMMIIHFHNYNFNLISINGHRPHKQKFMST